MSRRRFLGGSAAVAGVLLLGACGDDGDSGDSADTAATGARERDRLKPTPACDDGDPTPQQTEGPFYRPETPQRTRVTQAGVAGTPLLLSGRVLDTRCRPVGGALLDFWQADGNGDYDNEGFRLRGHQFADRRGRYVLSTVVPGNYLGRTRHIHARVQPRGGELLTTQLYFPGEVQNADDPLFEDALLIAMRDAGRGRRARFDFVLA